MSFDWEAHARRWQQMTPEERQAELADSDRRARAHGTRMLLDADDRAHDRSHPHFIEIKSEHAAACKCGWTGPEANISRHLEEVMHRERDERLAKRASS